MQAMQKWLVTFGVIALVLLVLSIVTYQTIEIEVPKEHIGVLMKLTGKDLDNAQEIAPDVSYKGIQPKILTDGRYYYNPYNWQCSIYPMVNIPSDKMGVRIRLTGDELPEGEFITHDEEHKGIVSQVLNPGLYPVNALVTQNNAPVNERPIKDYTEIIELHDPITIPAGFKGVVTDLTGPPPENPNMLISPEGFRGVQGRTLDPGTYYENPYRIRIDLIDCRSNRFNLAEDEEMGFPSKDGFWVQLDGIIEFRVNPEKAAQIYVSYNDVDNDIDRVNHVIHEEIIKKIIHPNARSFCRLRGSNSLGREFISGETRGQIQEDFETALRETCASQGVDIITALITKIYPPAPIAEPVRQREVLAQEKEQFFQEQLQAVEDAKLATELAMIEQKQKLVDAQREYNEKEEAANQLKDIALENANRDLEVAGELLLAAKDQAEALLATGKSAAAVVEFQNQADAAGWKSAVSAFGGSGEEYARYVMYQKLAPAYQSIQANSDDSPFVRIFDSFQVPLKPQPVEESSVTK